MSCVQEQEKNETPTEMRDRRRSCNENGIDRDNLAVERPAVTVGFPGIR